MLTVLFFVLACFLRADLGVDFTGLCGLLLISVALQVSPLLIQRKWGWNIGLALTATLFGLVLIGLLFKGWSLLVLGVIFFLMLRGPHKQGLESEKEPESRQWAGWVILVLASLWLFSVSLDEVWNTNYLSPFFKENVLLLKGNSNSFALINYGKMIQQFGVLGAGIHGLAELKYHVGSVIVMLAASEAVQRPLDFVYPFGAPLILLPFLFSCFHLVACEISKATSTKARLAIFATIAVLIVQFPNQRDLLNGWGLWRSYFVSESYALSLALFAAYLGALWSLVQRRTEKPGRMESILLILSPAVLTFTKISVGAIACVLFGLCFLYLFFKNPKRAPYVIAFFSAFFALLIEHLTRIPMPADWSWNIFINDYGHGNSFKFHLIYYHMFWLFLVGCGVLVYQKRFTASAKALLLAAAVTFVITWPVLHMAVPGGSGYYFTNIVMWIAILGLILVFSLQNARAQRILLAIGFVLSFGNAEEALRSVNVLRKEGAAVVRSAENQDPKTAVYRNFIHELRSLRSHPPKERTFVYISSEQTGYWQAWPLLCNESLLVPYLESDLPAIFGVPTRAEKGCWEYFSVPVWAGADYQKLPEKPNDDDLCVETKRFGGTEVIKLEQVPGSEAVRRVPLACGN